MQVGTCSDGQLKQFFHKCTYAKKKKTLFKYKHKETFSFVKSVSIKYIDNFDNHIHWHIELKINNLMNNAVLPYNMMYYTSYCTLSTHCFVQVNHNFNNKLQHNIRIKRLM